VPGSVIGFLRVALISAPARELFEDSEVFNTIVVVSDADAVTIGVDASECESTGCAADAGAV
jgi:hypothetical protein